MLVSDVSDGACWHFLKGRVEDLSAPNSHQHKNPHGKCDQAFKYTRCRGRLSVRSKVELRQKISIVKREPKSSYSCALPPSFQGMLNKSFG